MRSFLVQSSALSVQLSTRSPQRTSTHKLLDRRFYTTPDETASSVNMKILMLHGYTQNGPLFRAKTRALEKHLQKAFPNVSFCYPTGPLELRASDIPGFDPERSDPDDIQAYGWWRRSNTAEPPEYVGLDQGLEVVSQVIESEGPFDGVIGFSQGAALAAMVASLLEGPQRKEAFKKAQQSSSLAIAFPDSFERLQHPPLKFCAPYCGFIAPGERYTAFYKNPPLQTVSCHFIGSLDSVVEESRTQALVDAYGGKVKAKVVTHPGGHFVPSGKQFLDALVLFIRMAISSEGAKEQKEEERVEDMVVPF